MEVFASFESEVRSYCRAFPTVFAKARGHLLYDEAGREYIDFFSGAGTLNYGHNNPAFKKKLLRYLEEDAIVHSLDMSTVAKRRFMERFRDVVLEPRGLDYKIQFTGPTGADAVEAALKLARKATGRSEVIGFTNAYHGMTLAALAVTSNPKARAAAGVPLENVTIVPYEEVAEANRSGDHLRTTLGIAAERGTAPAAIILETVQAEGGINVASAAWLQEIAGLSREFEIPLIVDDVQAGCGRTGDFFSFEEAGIEPDIICLSKSLSGYGLPLACLLLKPHMDVWEPGQHTGTFRGNNLAFVTGAEAFTYWEDDAFSREIAGKGRIVRERLEGMAKRYSNVGLEVRGRGLIWGLELHAENAASEVTRDAFKRGLVIETAGRLDSVVKILPPLTIDEAALGAGLDIIEAAVEEHLSGGYSTRPVRATRS